MHNAKTATHNHKYGATRTFGVKLGDIRALAKQLDIDRKMALALWETGIADAQRLACLMDDPHSLSADELERMLPLTHFSQVADWFNSYLLKDRPDRESLRERWMASSNKWVLRSGWNLTASRIARKDAGIDAGLMLDKIESEMPIAPPEVQWTMNFALAYIGIHYVELRHRAIEIGEKLGVYRDYPVSKGCTSPFAPIWIAEMAARQNKSK